MEDEFKLKIKKPTKEKEKKKDFDMLYVKMHGRNSMSGSMKIPKSMARVKRIKLK